MPVSSVAVIGAGQAGLCSARRCIEEGYNVTVFEQSDKLGGQWYYVDETGKNQYGVNIHTAMYQGLRTNLPHQVMEYPDLHYPEDTPAFASQPDVLNYLHTYANRFDLKKYIKFNHLVIRVAPIEDNKWEVIVKDLPTNTFDTQIYDAIFICNGHFASPRIPDAPGAKEFKGKIMHSHDFRTAEAFRDQSALVVGAGTSGVDIVAHLSKTASRVTFSQRKVPNETKEERMKRESILPPKTKLQDDIKRFTQTGVEFIDGSHENFDVVIYATGYIHSYRFLSSDCGIHVDDNFVQPLYKQVLNIHHPTMAFICLISTACYNSVSDLQVRFALKYISGSKKLPSKADMLLDMHKQTQIHWSKGYPKHKTHVLGAEQKDYCNQLAETAEIENVPDVLLDIYSAQLEQITNNPFQIRNYKFKVIDEKTFEKIKND